LSRHKADVIRSCFGRHGSLACRPARRVCATGGAVAADIAVSADDLPRPGLAPDAEAF
jgi:hypothetical protein